ncbi:unnamed protein product [Toxocara canis]|uniref:Uncharacterized protein n=1 Tax=Toxocara canis TaxID=6265 RepID=A0A183UDD4_TOXCA|nr:unnamed protein product [Toxocara canis]
MTCNPSEASSEVSDSNESSCFGQYCQTSVGRIKSFFYAVEALIRAAKKMNCFNARVNSRTAEPQSTEPRTALNNRDFTVEPVLPNSETLRTQCCYLMPPAITLNPTRL